MDSIGRRRTLKRGLGLVAALAIGVLAPASPAAAAGLVGQWTFEDAAGAESTGNWSSFTLRGSATIAGGELAVAGTGNGAGAATAWAQAGGYSGPTIQDKTLVAWVRLDDLAATSGSPLSLFKSDEAFDAIVYAERQPHRWMAGSDFYRRYQSFASGTDDTATGTLRQVAVSYAGTTPGRQAISGCLNGVSLGSYATGAGTNETFAGSQGAEVLFGPRHRTGASPTGSINAHIAEARIYDGALTCAEVAALVPVDPRGGGGGGTPTAPAAPAAPAAASPEPPPAVAPPAGAAGAAPVVSSLQVKRRCVRRAELVDPTPKAGGLAFTYHLSVDATVKYVIKRRDATPARRRCPKPGAKGPAGRDTEVSTRHREGVAGNQDTSLATTATTTARRRSASPATKAGAKRVGLAEIAQARSLQPGTYVLYVSASDRLGRTSNVSRVKFWVLAGG